MVQQALSVGDELMKAADVLKVVQTAWDESNEPRKAADVPRLKMAREAWNENAYYNELTKADLLSYELARK